LKVGKLLNYIKATLQVEVEGYFVERFINLCKINNVNIWEIKNETPGKISFLTIPKEIKKIEPFLSRTKCKIKITKKKGIYFDIIKYKKRRVALYSLVLIILGIYFFSTFIWEINIYGNTNITTEEIKGKLQEIGVYKGKSQYNISKSKISDYIRSEIYEVAWVGVDIKGTTLNIQIVEKIISEQKQENEIIGDIVAEKSAVITKIVADNGTALYKLGSYIEAGSVAIEGKLYTNGEIEKLVRASGILKGETEYTFEKEYNYVQKMKQNVGKTRYGIGIGINNKYFILKYLPKDILYDISSEEKVLNIFGMDFKYIFNKYYGYTEYEKTYTKEKLIEIAEQDSAIFLSELENDGKKFLKQNVIIEETEDKIVYKVFYTMEENIGKFVKVGK